MNERTEQTEKLIKAYPFLTPSDSNHSGASLAAKNIKKLLKHLWPAVRFSVVSKQYSMGNNVSVSWTDGPTQKQVSAIVDKFESGSFDGMTDCYNYESSAWHIFGSTKYTFTSRTISQAKISEFLPAVNAAIEEARKQPEGDSQLFPIAGTKYLVQGNGYRIKLWGDQFLSECGTAEGIIDRILEDSQEMEPAKPEPKANLL